MRAARKRSELLKSLLAFRLESALSAIAFRLFSLSFDDCHYFLSLIFQFSFTATGFHY
jgi:hypothetical protein